jgi:hypothetical protein
MQAKRGQGARGRIACDPEQTELEVQERQVPAATAARQADGRASTGGSGSRKANETDPSSARAFLGGVCGTRPEVPVDRGR